MLGCKACSETEKFWDKLKQDYPKVTFEEKLLGSDTIDEYNCYIPKEIVREKVMIDGNEREVVSKRSPITAPNFVFTKDGEGFLGNIVGSNEQSVRYVLENLTK